MKKILLFLLMASGLTACKGPQEESKHRIMTLDPGHFSCLTIAKEHVRGSGFGLLCIHT